MKFLKWFAAILLVLIINFFGPLPATPKYTSDLPALPAEPAALEAYVHQQEAVHKLKPNNEARIIWANDSSKTKTEYAVIYLHGFSASQEEGDPVHIDFAKKFGCNLYLSRLAEHGIDTTEPLLTMTADNLWNSAKEAYAIGKQLGRKIIIMGCSTGGTLALKLAAEYPDIAGLILLSPNIAINDGAAWILNDHWGLQVAHMVKGTYNTSDDTAALYKQYWNSKYRMEATVQLEELLETTMKRSLFEKVKQPVLLMYYYKDEKNQDPVVKVSAMKRMFKQLGTPADQKWDIPVPEAGNHVIGSYIRSKDYKTVEAGCDKFASQILKLDSVNHHFQ
jgi:esterase/lipase